MMSPHRQLVATTVGLALAAVAAGPVVAQQSFSGADYPAEELLQTCQQADNDSRRGTALEIECEQYLIGFLDALKEAGYFEADASSCPPATNTADEARWAYVRWIHKDYSTRRAMPAADAVMAMLPDQFPCP